MITGNDVIEFRKRRHLSRKALAESAGLTEGKVWRIENKGTIHDDERRALELVGVVALGLGRESVAELPRESPQPEPVALIAPHTSVTVVAELPPVEVDWQGALAAAETSFLRFIANSEIQTFKRCRRKWWLAWHRGLVAKTESPVGVRQVGDRLHRALRLHYAPGPAVDLLEALEHEIAVDAAGLNDDTDAEIRKQFTDEANLERIMLEGYLAWLAETGADAELEVISAETYIEAPAPGHEDVALIGKIDVRVRRISDGAHLFIDHKSVGNLTQPVLTLPLDEQMKHYHLLERLQGSEHPTVGALYNMLRRVKRTQRANPPFYARVEVRHNDHEIENFKTRLDGEIADILAVGTALDEGAPHQLVAYPRPSRDCTWDCPFFAVCPMFDDGSRAEAMLEQYFDKRDPLQYYLDDVLGENL